MILVSSYFNVFLNLFKSRKKLGLLICFKHEYVQIHLLMQYKSFIDYPTSMKVELLESDNEDNEKGKTIKEKHPKSEVKQSVQTTFPTNLVYPPNSSNSEKEEPQGVKAQPKSQVKVLKNELKNEKSLKKTLAYYGQNEKKKEIQRLAYPPPEKQIPLRTSKFPGKNENRTKQILEESALDAKLMIHKMKVLYKKDLQKFSSGELAYHKVKYLKTLSEKLSNAYVKRQFIEQKGLKQFERWLDRIVNEDRNEFEPSLTLRLGLIKILKEMNLTPEQIEKTKYLMPYVQRNRMSQVLELRQLSIDLIKQWEYNIMTENNADNKK